MASAPSTASRIKGSLFGLACTDALGAPVEFKKRGTFDHVDRYLPNENFGTAAGTWTDDTSMALCMAEGIIDHKGTFIPQAVIRNWVAWYRNGHLSATGYCFDIGNATRTALAGWDDFFRTHPKISKDDLNAHAEGQLTIDKHMNKKSFCGNGALMRIAPLPLVYHRSNTQLKPAIIQSAVATHPYPLNSDCCTVYCSLIVACFSNLTKSQLAYDLASIIGSIPRVDSELEHRLSKYVGLDVWEKQPSESIKSSGYVLDTLEAALWAFFTTDSFQAGAIKVVNLGDDADTVGAVYGGLAGAFYGFESIPKDWISGLVKADVVGKIADGLVKAEVSIKDN
ncbi:MAG: hypothetical protein M1814_005674 [Vezdaea aestivalis]|nr:MAG: hypothetical protein M1814_005674 [Vezdaea aestivalis]